MLHPMGPHPQSMGFQPKTETNTADYQVSELKLFFVCVSLIIQRGLNCLVLSGLCLFEILLH